MKITQDVVKDLLTVHLAGEASADTRALIENWLRTDPELARQVQQARNSDLPPVPPLSPTIEKRALDRTRRQLRWEKVLLGMAIFVSMLPFSFTFDSDGVGGLLIADWPERAMVIAFAGVLWLVYGRVSRRVRL
jgi:hypothetical protein